MTSFIEYLTKKTLVESSYTRTPFDFEEFVNQRRYLDYQLLTLGSNKTVFDVISKEKFIDHSLWPVTESELARTYLHHIFQQQAPKAIEHNGMDSRRVPWSKKTFPLLEINPPIFFAKQHTGDLAYIDIKSAYYQLYQHLTLDFSFNPDDHILSHGRIKFLDIDELKNHKAIRNTMIGICRAKTVNQITYGKYFIRNTYNRWLAPELWGYLMYMLHAVARDIKQRFPVHYIHTDGYIINQEDTDAVQAFFMNEWGLQTTIKAQGHGTVHALGNYTIANVVAGASEDIRGEHVDNTRSLKNLTPQLARILKRWRIWLLEHHLKLDSQHKAGYNTRGALAANVSLFGNDANGLFENNSAASAQLSTCRFQPRTPNECTETQQTPSPSSPCKRSTQGVAP